MYLEQVWLPTGTKHNLHPKPYNTVNMYLFQVMLTCIKSLLNPFKNTELTLCSVCVSQADFLQPFILTFSQ